LRKWISKSLLLFSTLLTIAIGNAAENKQSTVLIIPIQDELHYFVEKVLESFTLPLSEHEINQNILQAALLFDALGAYRIRYQSSLDTSQVLAKLAGKDTVYVKPVLDVFAGRAGGAYELAVVYAAILETSGIATAFVEHSGRFWVLFDTGVHRKYAGAISRDITSYLIRKNRVWLPVDATSVGNAFYKTWENTSLKTATNLYDILPVRSTAKEKVETAKIFTTAIKRRKLDQLFMEDRNFFENEQAQRKLKHVQAVMIENQRLAANAIECGMQKLNSGAYDLAVREFEYAAELGDNTAQALFLIAKVFAEKKDYEEMKRTGLRLVQYDGRDPRGYWILGYAYNSLGQLDVGAQFFSKAKFLENYLLTVGKTIPVRVQKP
jgi:hypothetical protein